MLPPRFEVLAASGRDDVFRSKRSSEPTQGFYRQTERRRGLALFEPQDTPGELAECFVTPSCDEAAGCPLVRGSLRSTEGENALRKQGSHKGAASHGLWCHRSAYAV